MKNTKLLSLISFIAINLMTVNANAQQMRELKPKTDLSSTDYEWELIWSDEFNSPGKSLPDPDKWTYETGGHGWGNNEEQFYVEESIDNSYVENGKLHIRALKQQHEDNDYTSAKLTTYGKLGIQYGRIEVMAKLPAGKGTWPAIWMLPESVQDGSEDWPLCGEIDIMEHVGKDMDMVHVSLHSELYNHIKGTQVTYSEKVDNVADDFHKYGISWTDKYIKFYVDDILFYEAYKGEDGRVSTNEGWPFDKPYYLILNLAVGGNWGGEIGESVIPCEMEVDYVRVYKRR